MQNPYRNTITKKYWSELSIRGENAVRSFYEYPTDGIVASCWDISTRYATRNKSRTIVTYFLTYRFVTLLIRCQRIQTRG